MRKGHKKTVSVIVALAFLLTMVLAYAGPAMAATYCKFTGAYTEVIADDGQPGGTAEVRQNVDNNGNYLWADAGVNTVLVSVTLPDGVEYSHKPEKSTTDYVYYGNYVTVSTGVNVEFVSGSTTRLEIKLTDPDSANFDGKDVKVTFGFSTPGKSTLDIESDFAGDVKATVEVVGLAGNAVKFRESEAITVARVAGADKVVVSAATAKSVTIGSGREGAKITIAEAYYNALSTGTRVYLEVVTPGVEFDSGMSATGIKFADQSITVDEDTAWFTVGTRTVSGVAGSFEVTPKLVVNPSAAGDIKVKVSFPGTDISSTTVTVARVLGQVAFTVTDVKNTGGTIYAGHPAVTLKEGGKEAQFTIKSVAGDFPTDTIFTVTLKGAKFNSEFTTSPSTDVHLYNDDKSAWFKVPEGENEITLRGFELKAAGDAAAGDIVAVLSSNLGSFDTSEVVLGKVAKPITASASSAPQVAYLGKAQPAGDITITEAKDGAIKEDGIKLVLPEGVKFASKPTVEVTEGNIDISSSLDENNSVLKITLDKASGTASTIKISGIKYDVTRLALDGDVEVQIRNVKGSGTGIWLDDDKTLATVVNAKVVSEPTAAPAPTKREASFVIGSTTYKVNGKDYTMDVAPYIDAASGRTYLPVRYVAYALGVSEDNIFYSNGVVSLLKDGRAVQMTIGSKVLRVNGVDITMDAAPVIKDGRTMLPFRWIATALGASVSWDDASKTVTMVIE